MEETASESVRIATCPNCDTEVTGPYCASCGQQQKNLNKYFWTLAGEALDDVLRPNSRTARTLALLYFRPGHLTTEYFAGRRARYVPPFRLYLIISFLFFIVMPLVGALTSDSNIVIEGQEDDGTPAQVWSEEVDADTQIRLPWLSEEENQQLSERFQSQLKKFLDLAQEDPSDLGREVMDVFSAVMFFLLPIFAILLKIFYVGSGYYYAEHLLLAVHNHCFVFLSFLFIACLQAFETTVVAVVTEPIVTALSLWLPAYMYFSMKHTYDQSHLVTVIKYLMLTAAYIVLASAGIIAALLFSIMLA